MPCHFDIIYIDDVTLNHPKPTTHPPIQLGIKKINFSAPNTEQETVATWNFPHCDMKVGIKMLQQVLDVPCEQKAPPIWGRGNSLSKASFPTLHPSYLTANTTKTLKSSHEWSMPAPCITTLTVIFSDTDSTFQCCPQLQVRLASQGSRRSFHDNGRSP